MRCKAHNLQQQQQQQQQQQLVLAASHAHLVIPTLNVSLLSHILKTHERNAAVDVFSYNQDETFVMNLI